VAYGELQGAEAAAMEEAVRGANAMEFVSELPDGMQAPIGNKGGRLSGGQRQRLAIARAMLKDAPIVLLDEATASVDASAEVEIQRAIDALVKAKTVVVIAHRLRTVRRAHQIVVLDGGRVVEAGTHDALVAREGAYARMWREQERAKRWRLAASATTPSE
ncbi:MAG: ATP-binding cassette domain-containing protein, partial [Polyangiales bacterium]